MYKIYNERGEAFLVAQMVKNLPAVQEIWIWFQGKEDSLEEGMGTHSTYKIYNQWGLTM